MKKLMSILLVAIMLMSVTGAAFAADEPLTIKFWHTRGSGNNLKAVETAVNAFNESVGKEKGIVVVAEYIGNYEATLTKLQLQSRAEEMPEVAVVAATQCPVVFGDGLIVDMTELAKADNFDIDNLLDVFQAPYSVYEGQLISVPYIRSNAVLIYNKTMADAKNLTAPKTIAELEAFARALTVVENGETKVYGLQIHSDFVFFNGGMLENLGGSFLAPDGLSCPAVENDAMLTMLSTWRRWIDEGICQPFAATSASAAEKEAFLQGRLGCFYNSCGGVGDLMTKAEAAGFELGVAMLPAWGDVDTKCSTGGGNVVLCKGDNTDEEIKAGWEFIKFLMSDAMVADNAITSGYLPVTKSVAEYETMKNFWAEKPQFKVAYDQLQYAFNPPISEYYTDLKNACTVAVSMLIQEQSITAEEAVEQIKEEIESIFP